MKWLLIIIILAGVGGYFTRPDEAKMSSAADHLLGEASNPVQAVGNAITGAVGDRAYSDYYVATKYTVGDAVTCWGAFTQVSCSRNKPADSK